MDLSPLSFRMRDWFDPFVARFAIVHEMHLCVSLSDEFDIAISGAIAPFLIMEPCIFLSLAMLPIYTLPNRRYVESALH